jgi:hypothetical protein
MSIFLMGAVRCFIKKQTSYRHQKDMTSVLYSAGLNYQVGNPVRQEIVSIRREVDSLRKQIEALTEENQIYRKHLMKLTALLDEGKGQSEFTQDLMSLARAADASSSSTRREAGVGTVQGGGFRR